jgi:hypothetical protein
MGRTASGIVDGLRVFHFLCSNNVRRLMDDPYVRGDRCPDLPDFSMSAGFHACYGTTWDKDNATDTMSLDDLSMSGLA